MAAAAMQDSEHATTGGASTSSAPQRLMHLPLTPPYSPRAAPKDARTTVSSLSSLSDSSQHATRETTQSHAGYMESLKVPSNDEFARITDVQTQREAEQRRRSRELQREKKKSVDLQRNGASQIPSESTERKKRHASIFRHGGHAGSGGASLDDLVRAKAATLIQRTYRGYRTRREMKGLGLDASTRWTHAIREAQFRELTRPKARSMAGGEELDPSKQEGHRIMDTPADGSEASRAATARQNWKKAAVIARRAGNDADEGSSSDSEDEYSSSFNQTMSPEEKEAARKRREEARARRRKDAKVMGLQYFLEMVDVKHRYGSNLRTYHEEWKKSDTKENFFYWLDYGEGRHIDMASCPRERLDREQVRYLSREERQYYLVTVDKEGRLCWSKNGIRIDTTEEWKDSVHGIVPADDPTPAFQPMQEDHAHPPSENEDSDVESADESELEAARAAKYADALDQQKGMKRVTHLSASTIMNQLLRKSVRKNTWIFVADTSFRLYVGIKDSGAFQHSSFLQGSRISAAGLIKIKNGRLASLSPLSGHYRPPASNFRAFVKSLKEEGVDMSHVSISKSYAVLVGLEMYVRTRQKGKHLIQKITHHRDKLVNPEEVRKQEEAERDKSESAAKEREFLEKERKREEMEREENKASAQLLQKLHISPRIPAGQKGGGEAEEQQNSAAAAAAAENISSTVLEK